MRFVSHLLFIVLLLTGSNVLGQYYMFDADENGVAIEYARAKDGDLTAQGFGLTVKSNEYAGIFLGYSWTRPPDGFKVKNYTLGYERYFISETRGKIKPVVIPSIGLDHTSLPYDLTVTSLVPGAALGIMGPISETGRTVTAAGAAAWVPIRSSAGVDTKVTTTIFASTTIAFRVTPKVIFGGGVTYSDSSAEGSEGLFEFKVGLMFATKMVGSK